MYGYSSGGCPHGYTLSVNIKTQDCRKDAVTAGAYAGNLLKAVSDVLGGMLK